MITKTIEVATPRVPAPSPLMLWPAGPCSTEDKLARIATLGKRIDRYVQFMSRVGNDNGVSADSREQGVNGFYVQLVAAERDLNRLYEKFRLE